MILTCTARLDGESCTILGPVWDCGWLLLGFLRDTFQMGFLMQRLLIAPLSPLEHPCGSLPKLLRRQVCHGRARVAQRRTMIVFMPIRLSQHKPLHYKEARSCTLAAASSQSPLPSVTRSITIESFAGSAVPVRSRKLASYQDFKKNARLLSMPASLISFSLIPCLTDRCLCIFGSISSSTELIGRKIFNLFVQENKKMNQWSRWLSSMCICLQKYREYLNQVCDWLTSNTQFKANRTDIKTSRSLIVLSCWYENYLHPSAIILCPV